MHIFIKSKNYILYICNKRKQNKNETKYLQKLYTTNDICESIVSELNFYLPKRVRNPDIFIKSITKYIFK